MLLFVCLTLSCKNQSARNNANVYSDFFDLIVDEYRDTSMCLSIRPNPILPAYFNFKSDLGCSNIDRIKFNLAGKQFTTCEDMLLEKLGASYPYDRQSMQNANLPSFQCSDHAQPSHYIYFSLLADNYLFSSVVPVENVVSDSISLITNGASDQFLIHVSNDLLLGKLLTVHLVSS